MIDQPVNNVKRKEIEGPPAKSRNIVSDIKNFFLNTPSTSTLVKINSDFDRNRYSDLIYQRTGISVDEYKVLNIHRIGINAGSSFIFDELLTWDGDSKWWPNHIAKANLVNGSLNKIKITLFGLSHSIFRLKNGIFGYHLLHLFNLSALKIQDKPDALNGRLMLYKCSGGYPIGIFCLYVRDSRSETGEKEMSQLFTVVGFNFYGNKSLSNLNLLNKTWENIHNRVTTNVMNRIKIKCEWDFNNEIISKSELHH